MSRDKDDQLWRDGEYDDFERNGEGFDLTEELVYDFDGPIGDGTQGPVPRKVIDISPTPESVHELHKSIMRTARYLEGMPHQGRFVVPDIELKGTYTTRSYHEGQPPLEEVGSMLPEEEEQVKPTRKEIAERMMAKYAEILVELDKLPGEPQAAEGSPFPPIIFFSKTFPGSDQEYTYLLYKAPHNGRWYASGNRQVGKAYTWDQLMEWLANSGPMPTLYRVTGLEEYWAPEDDEVRGE